MKIIEIAISRTAKINLGNYEALDHFVSMKAEVEEGENVLTAATALATKVEKAMARQLVRSYLIRGKKVMGTLKAVAVHHGLPLALPKEDK